MTVIHSLLAGIGLTGVALLALTVPMVGAVVTIAAENLLAYFLVLPVKWTIEGLHRYVHRNG